MPRRARIVMPGYLHHVTQRGNYRQKIFLDDQDRVKYLKLMNESCRQHDNEIFAYCLMNNHVHFIVRPKYQHSLGEAFCRAHQRYSWYFHKRKGTRGHLWQERFYSCVLHGSHILKAIKYVERNPVRAKMVQQPWDYSWSSTRAHLGKKYQIVDLTDISEYVDVTSWKDYLMGDEMEEDLTLVREATMKGLVLGPDDFIKKVEGVLGRVLSFRKRGRPKIEK